MSHETLKLNRHEKFDEDESEIVVKFKYHAGMPAWGVSKFEPPTNPPEDPEIEILRIETLSGADITDLISEEEYQEIEDRLYDQWEDEDWESEVDYIYSGRSDLD